MKTKITLSVDEAVWLAFRGECIKRKLQASSLVEEWMQEQLTEWKKEDKKK